MNLLPLHDYVLLEELTMKTIVKGLIEDDEEESHWAKVLKTTSSLVSEGQTVLIKRHLFDKVSYEGTEYLLGKIESVVAVLA